MKHEFHHQWGGEDTWYTKGKRWANKQKFPLNHLALGFIEWLWQHWVDGRVELEMSSVDKQAEDIKKQWEKQEKINEEKKIVIESTPSEVEGLDNIRIKNTAILPDPWDCDWNDAGINYKMWKENESHTPST